MPFKVRFKVVGWAGDVEHYPCHYGYEIGDEFTFDGERFEGRICPGCLPGVIRLLPIVMYSGFSHPQRILFMYSGLSARDPSRKKYDGIGFRPLKKPLEGSDPRFIEPSPLESPMELKRSWGFTCDDTRTAARFRCEPIGLASGGDSLPYYNREMNILEKIKGQPGLTADEILNKFSDWEREEIYPPLHPINVRLMLDELATVDYIELRDGKAYPKNPPK
jgi:uncharacterized repeat protein (TIGR04076 family)